MKTVKVLDISKYVNKLCEKREKKLMAIHHRKLALIENDKKIILITDDAVHYIIDKDNPSIRIPLYEKSDNKITVFPCTELEISSDNINDIPFLGNEDLTTWIRKFGGRIESNVRILKDSIKSINLNPDDYIGNRD